MLTHVGCAAHCSLSEIGMRWTTRMRTPRANVCKRRKNSRQWWKKNVRDVHNRTIANADRRRIERHCQCTVKHNRQRWRPSVGIDRLHTVVYVYVSIAATCSSVDTQDDVVDWLEPRFLSAWISTRTMLDRERSMAKVSPYSTNNRWPLTRWHHRVCCFSRFTFSSWQWLTICSAAELNIDARARPVLESTRRLPIEPNGNACMM